MFTMSQLLHSGSISAPPRAIGPGRLCRTFPVGKVSCKAAERASTCLQGARQGACSRDRQEDLQEEKAAQQWPRSMLN